MRCCCVAFLRLAAAAALVWAVAAPLPGQAQDRRGGFRGAGLPVFVPAYPIYPYSYQPPLPAAEPEPGAWPYITDGNPAPFSASTTRCLAGAYICPAAQPGAVGSPCLCLTPTTHVPGHIG